MIQVVKRDNFSPHVGFIQERPMCRFPKYSTIILVLFLVPSTSYQLINNIESSLPSRYSTFGKTRSSYTSQDNRLLCVERSGYRNSFAHLLLASTSAETEIDNAIVGSSIHSTTTTISSSSSTQQQQQPRQLNLSPASTKDKRQRRRQKQTTTTTKSKYSAEFGDMVGEFAYYTDREISSVPSKRYQAMFHGVHAAANEPSVYRSFEVLYEDVGPLRVAGRMIFAHLKRVKENSVANRQEEEKILTTMTGLTTREIDEGRRVFLSLQNQEDNNAYDDDDSFITKDQLIQSGILDIIAKLNIIEDFLPPSEEEIVQHFHMDKKERLTFQHFMMGMHERTMNSFRKIPSVLAEMEQRTSHNNSSFVASGDKKAHHNIMILNKKQQKHSDRFDDMLIAFGEWETKMQPGDGRTFDIVRGCFTGAKNPKVVEGLKIVYMDYYPLRFAGDLVFKIASGVFERM